MFRFCVQSRRRWRVAKHAGLLSLLSIAIVGVFASSAFASATLGQTGAPTGDAFNGDQEIGILSAAVPAGGGTIFQTQSGTCPLVGTYNFQVLRPEGGDHYLVVGDTGNQTDPCDSQLHSYPVSIPVQAGDVLGVYIVSPWHGILSLSGSVEDFDFQAEPGVGDTISLPGSGSITLDESATLVTDSDLALGTHADITTNATSPAGAVVNYTAPSATDEDLSTVSVSCVPTSGSTFAIGDTTVTCTATDTDGDSNSPVQTTFNVHVKGAAEQLTDLQNAVTGVGPGTSLKDKVTSIQTSLAAGQTSTACGTLAAFVNEVKAQTGKSISTATAATLIATAQGIEAVIPCTT